MARSLKKALQNSALLRQKLFPNHPSPPAGDNIAAGDLSNVTAFFSAASETLSKSYGASRGFRSRAFSSLCASPPVRNSVSKIKVSELSNGRQFYHTDSRGFQHFEGRGLKAMLQTPEGKRKLRQYTIIFVAITTFFGTIYVTHLEVVPYTYRKHFVLIPPHFEVALVDEQFQVLKQQWKSQILPPIHPQSIRVRKIAKDIIRAVMEGTKAEEDWDTLEFSDNGLLQLPGERGREVLAWRDSGSLPASAQWNANDEVLDDRWVDETREKAKKKGLKPFVEHLKLMKWEVLVVEKDIVNAFCLPGGKIVVYTGLLRRFPADAEIATVLGHEVAHVVARHSAERLTRHLFLTMIELFLLAFFYAPDIVRTVSVLFLELPFSRRQELEADHIGLLLMAAAGYDPRVAPHLYEKLGKLSGASDLLQYVTTHPSGKKRGELLRKTGTMEQASKIYQHRTQGKVIEGYLTSH